MYVPIEFTKEYEKHYAGMIYEYQNHQSTVPDGTVGTVTKQFVNLSVYAKRYNWNLLLGRWGGTTGIQDGKIRALRFSDDQYHLSYAIDDTKYATLSFVYKIEKYDGDEKVHNYVFHTVADKEGHSGVCFLKDQRTLRIYSADGVSRFADFYPPTMPGYWSAITIQYCFKSGKVDSGVWVNWRRRRSSASETG